MAQINTTNQMVREFERVLNTREDYAKQSEDKIHVLIASANRRMGRCVDIAGMATDMFAVQELTAALIIKKRNRKAA